ncbi:single-stranded DNA-binding protein [Candidatus Berkelbacteria bacterium]|nr:single-stranded DNA-binding protein [Candidatus Berkelbacteria bacterium]MBI2588121.1 single-stranded DNA-binding protein [Candidatus Berkelbacteria bacterium]MBI4029696.1 single-stranded DNA-binding protein [Candidatus Berkelbacteria bacterium]
MAFSLNRAQIIGNLTRDPELRYIPSGRPVASFGVATNRRWKDQSGEIKEDAQFHDVVAWGKLAEICNQILKKGNKVYVEGRLQTRNWEAADGSKRQKTEIIMENFVALTPKGAPLGVDIETENIEAPTEKESAKPSESAKTDAKTEKETTKKGEEKTEEEESLDEIPF